MIVETPSREARKGDALNHPDQAHLPLTEETFRQGISVLVERDPDLALAIAHWGLPPFWTHAPGFPGLVLAILSQQVSLASAEAAFTRLGQRLSSVDPQGFLTLDDGTLREIGFSRQKAGYVRGLSEALLAGELDLKVLDLMEDDQARETLLKIRGIGRWTADTYLLFALRRPDAWSPGDLALWRAIQDLKGSELFPSDVDVDRFAERWSPWRAVAARILWHQYLSQRGRS